MRDIFEEVFGSEPVDPMEAARRGARPNLRKRFYQTTSIAEGEGGFAILLDGRPVRTPAKAALAAPSRELAEKLAAEWDAQRDVIDPTRMPLTRLANAIIDGVANRPEPARAEIEKYLRSDLLFYRAEEPEGLVTAQAQHWDPIVRWADDALDARFVPTQGLAFAPQPAEAIAAAAKAIPEHPWRLGAANAVTALTSSALLALALAHGRLDAGQAWAAAHVDEDWNMAKWGRDEQALARRDYRFAEMQAAAQVLSMTRA